MISSVPCFQVTLLHLIEMVPFATVACLSVLRSRTYCGCLHTISEHMLYP